MSRSIRDLDPRMQALARELIGACDAVGIPLVVVDTLRTPEEHAENLKAGTSWIKRSKHLDGLAIDVCPKALIQSKGWAPLDERWQDIGKIGERLGLRWGGRWKKPVKPDLGHFEVK